MKKTLLVLIAALMVLTACSSKGGGSNDTLTVASPAKQNGDFVNGFSTNAYDQWAVKLMAGGDTHYVDRATSEYKLNPTFVDNLDITTDGEGNKTYTYTLKEGNVWSDGEPITAKDYVFSLLFGASQGWREVATQTSIGRDLVGFDAYSKGETDVFEGVKYIDEKTFSVTIDKANLPYYFEVISAVGSPDPTHVWFKDAKFNADGNGFDNTAAELAAAVKLVAEEERYAPSVAAGAYTFDSFKNNATVLKLNDKYAGNFEGKKATIPTIVIRLVESKVVVAALEKGEVDISPGEIEKPNIDAATEAGLQLHDYPRNGYGMIVYKANKGPTAIKEVRQALGYLVDRQQFVDKIVGGFGSTVNGPYGLSQWFYKENKDTLESELNNYVLNVAKANELLDQTDYKYEADGVTPFDASKVSEENYYRYNSAKEELLVKHFGSEENSVTDLIISSIVPTAKEAGVNYYIEQGEFSTLGSYMQGREENDFNAFNLATSFTSVYDPYTGHHSDFVGRGSNWSDIADPELDAAIEAIRRKDPTDRQGYSDAVVDYLILWNDLLPSLPLYSNLYHDFATQRVEGMEVITPEMGWELSIEYLSLK